MSLKWNQFFYSRFFLLCILVAIVFVGFGYGRAYYQDFKVKQEISRLEEESRNLDVKKLESLEILKFVQSKEFAEAKARTELNMKKADENVVVIKREKNIDKGRQEEKEVLILKNIPNPVRWWRYFMEKEN